MFEPVDYLTAANSIANIEKINSGVNSLLNREISYITSDVYNNSIQ